MEKQKLGWGAAHLVPEGAPAAWGARLIITQSGDVDMVHDRQHALVEGRRVKVDIYPLLRRDGSRIRMATKVTHPDGRVLHFVERLPKRAAIAQATKHFDLADAVADFQAARIEKYEFYARTADYPAAQVASAADIPIDVVLDRRRYLRQLAEMTL